MTLLLSYPADLTDGNFNVTATEESDSSKIHYFPVSYCSK